MNFEQQVLEHMLQTREALGVIKEKLETGEEMHALLKSTIEKHGEGVKDIPGLKVAVTDITERVTTIEGKYNKAKWTLGGMAVGLGTAAGSAADIVKDGVKHLFQ